jgi:hypothetical protein
MYDEFDQNFVFKENSQFIHGKFRTIVQDSDDSIDPGTKIVLIHFLCRYYGQFIVSVKGIGFYE